MVFLGMKSDPGRIRRGLFGYLCLHGVWWRIYAAQEVGPIELLDRVEKLSDGRDGQVRLGDASVIAKLIQPGL